MKALQDFFRDNYIFTFFYSPCIHVIIGNRAWPSLNGGSLEIIIVYLTSLKNRHVLGHFIR